MEDTNITYDLILKYLVGNNTQSVNNVCNAINIQSDILKSNFEFKEYFPYKKTGVNKKNSFISSILYLIEDNYKLLSEDEQNKLNDIFLIQLKSKWNSLKKVNNHTNISKEDGFNGFNDKIIPIVSNILLLNIIIIDFENNKFYINGDSEKINKNKGFILITKYKNNYEPVSDGDKKIFDFQDLHLDIQEIIEDKSYTIEEILKLEGYHDNNFKVNLDDYNKSKLNKMKKEQLMNLVEILKLNVSEKETKNNIIELILSQKK
jgi:hypothetical protein